MERLDLDELEACAGAFDQAVDATAGVDRFCSRSAWVIPYHRAFGPGRELHAYRGGAGPGASFVLLALARAQEGRALLVPLESMWAFACPLAGEGAGELLARLLDGPLGAWPVWLTGVPPSGPATAAWATALRGRVRAQRTDDTVRCVASLEGGLDGFLARRSRAFRRGLRAAARDVRDAGIRFEHVRPAAAHLDALYARVRAVERRSWKTAAGNGVAEGPMAAFYAAMWPRLAREGALQVWLARDADGRDVGYLHGAALDGRFRGLQFSFDAELRELGLGNALQLEALRTLCEQGIGAYDLGAVAPYKQRWAEGRDATVSLLLLPRGGGTR